MPEQTAGIFPQIHLTAPDDDADDDAAQPPRFTVDLSEAPARRYSHVAAHMAGAVAESDLAGLFDDLVRSFAPRRLVPAVHALARLSLRRLFDRDQTAELRAISAAAAIPMHLLVAFNLLLDLLLGCSSGGMRVACPSASQAGNPAPRSRMLHFRTLDWGMDPLRSLIVELDFVRRPGGPVVATSITYFGYVGVLTGVRRGLSMGLNFRPHHDRSSWRRRLSFRWHQAMVLLGFRQSVSSVLRALLLTPDDELDSPLGSGRCVQVADDDKTETLPGLGRRSPRTVAISAPILPYIRHTLPSTASTAAYLIFCTPDEVHTLEKDNGHGRFHSSGVFHGTYNHDMQDETHPERLEAAAHGLAEDATGMETLVEWSIQRKKVMEDQWNTAARLRSRQTREADGGDQKFPARNKRVSKRRGTDQERRVGCDGDHVTGSHEDGTVYPDDLVKMVLDPEICNDETHYAVIMDPGPGKVLWRRMFPLELVHADSMSEGAGRGS